MVDLVSGPAIERLAPAVAAEARRLPALARRVAPPPAAAFGGLAGAAALAASLAELCAVLDAELAAAAANLDDASVALDATRRATHTADADAARLVAGP